MGTKIVKFGNRVEKVAYCGKYGVNNNCQVWQSNIGVHAESSQLLQRKLMSVMSIFGLLCMHHIQQTHAHSTYHTHAHSTYHTHTPHMQNVHLIDVNLTIMILSRRLSWCTLQELQESNGSLNFKRWMVVACTLLVIAWSVVRLIQQTSLFNLLFLFYP